MNMLIITCLLIKIIIFNQFGNMSSPKPRFNSRSNQTAETSINLQESHQYFQQNLDSGGRMLQLEEYLYKKERQAPKANQHEPKQTIQEKDSQNIGGKKSTWQEKYCRIKGKHSQIKKMNEPNNKQQIANGKINSLQKEQVERDQPNDSSSEKTNQFQPQQRVVIPNFLNSDINMVGINNSNIDSMGLARTVLFNDQKIQNSRNQQKQYSQPPQSKQQRPQQSNSDSDDDIFQKRRKQKQKQKPKPQLANQSITMQNYSLIKILNISSLYDNYLDNRFSKKLSKKLSLDLPELWQNSNKLIPQGCFFKPNRVIFNKAVNQQIREGSYNQYHYLCKINQQRTFLYYQDLRSEQLKNLNGVKCQLMKLQKQDNISPHVQYDYIYQRFYLFSNKGQTLLVYSEQQMELLCKIPVRKRVNNPNMHFCQINGRHFLFLLGGYIKAQRQIAQGNNNIQIFELNRWHLDMRSRVVKLIIGRINPILIHNKQSQNSSFLILGGNTIAKVNSKGIFDFQYEKEINQSTNMTGISINTEEIIELFQDQQHTTISNLSVKIENPFSLHSGVVFNLNQRQWLILPGSLHLFQVKLFNKEVNIIEATAQFLISSALLYQKRQICLKSETQIMNIYLIDERGILNIKSSKRSKVQKWCCHIY